MKRATALGRKRRLAAVLRIGVAAMAVTVVLTGCGVRDRIADGSHPVGRPATTSDTSTPSTGSATGTSTTGAAGATSTDAELSSIDQALSGIGSTLSGVDSQITQADKAADGDN